MTGRVPRLPAPAPEGDNRRPNTVRKSSPLIAVISRSTTVICVNRVLTGSRRTRVEAWGAAPRCDGGGEADHSTGSGPRRPPQNGRGAPEFGPAEEDRCFRRLHQRPRKEPKATTWTPNVRDIGPGRTRIPFSPTGTGIATHPERTARSVPGHMCQTRCTGTTHAWRNGVGPGPGWFDLG